MRKIERFEGKHRFLSNFYPSPITYEGITYPTVEHAFQASKTLDIEERRRIAKLATPGEAKKAGRALDLRDDWEEVKERIMSSLLWLKFRDARLANKLADTEDAELIESNDWGDTYWGKCRGKGKNRSGVLLMEIRSNL